MRIIKNTIIIIILILATGSIFTTALTKSLTQECYGWIDEYEQYKQSEHYYWAEWQVIQCDELIGYKFGGKIK